MTRLKVSHTIAFPEENVPHVFGKMAAKNLASAGGAIKGSAPSKGVFKDEDGNEESCSYVAVPTGPEARAWHYE